MGADVRFVEASNIIVSEQSIIRNLRSRPTKVVS